MRAVIQRVVSANVKINKRVKGKINKGIVVFLGVGQNDSIVNIKKTADKILSLRIFQNDLHKMDYSITDICGDILVISQFTLYANCLKGNRPSFIDSAGKLIATPFFDLFINLLIKKKIPIKTGVFGSDMKINLTNDGPVTIMLEFKK